MRNLVSVIVPVYKTEKFLYRCVDSIRNQDYSQLEIILVDDGSPDKSGAICDELSKVDSRIHVIHKKNGGLSSARNYGIEASNGEFLCFVDSDDYVAKDYVSTLLDLIRKHNSDIAKIDYVEVSSENFCEKKEESKESVYVEKGVEKAFLELRVDSACVFMYKRELIDNTRFIIGKTSEDIPFNFEIFLKAKSFAYKPVKKYFYWHNPDSISNGPLDKNMLNYLQFRKSIFEHYKNQGDEEMLRLSEALYARAAMGLMVRMAAFGLSENMNEVECRKLFKDTFKAHSKAFYLDNGTEINRKILAFSVFNFYYIVKFLCSITGIRKSC